MENLINPSNDSVKKRARKSYKNQLHYRRRTKRKLEESILRKKSDHFSAVSLNSALETQNHIVQDQQFEECLHMISHSFHRGWYLYL